MDSAAKDAKGAFTIIVTKSILAAKVFAVPWQALSFDLSEKVALLDIEKDGLRNAPRFNKDRWPDMADPS